MEGPHDDLIGAVFKERDYRFDRHVRVLSIEQDKAVVETVHRGDDTENWRPVFGNGRTTRVRLERLLTPSKWTRL